MRAHLAPQVGLERSRQVLGALQSLGVAGKDIMRAKRLDALNQAGYVNVQWSLDVSSVTDLQVCGAGGAGGWWLGEGCGGWRQASTNQRSARRCPTASGQPALGCCCNGALLARRPAAAAGAHRRCG
jgi:hypothetical protein